MVDRIGKDSALTRAAVQAAIQQTSERIAAARPSLAGPEAVAPAESAQGTPFADALAHGLDGVEHQVQSAESLPLDLLTGKVDDFHQIAVQLKSAELSFKFAMEIRNKLVDAYREIMRMNV